jgi:hypothetical protein
MLPTLPQLKIRTMKKYSLIIENNGKQKRIDLPEGDYLEPEFISCDTDTPYPFYIVISKYIYDLYMSKKYSISTLYAITHLLCEHEKDLPCKDFWIYTLEEIEKNEYDKKFGEQSPNQSPDKDNEKYFFELSKRKLDAIKNKKLVSAEINHTYKF